MEYDKFGQFTDDQLQSIADGKADGYSAKEIETVRGVLEWRKAKSEIRYCTKCGNQLEGNACPVCGQAAKNVPPPPAKKRSNVYNPFVWITLAITVFTAVSHLGYATTPDYITYPFNYQYMWGSIALYLAGSLLGFKDCRLGVIFYACGIAIDIFGPSITMGGSPVVIAYGFGSAIIPIIALVLLVCGISFQKKLSGQKLADAAQGQ